MKLRIFGSRNGRGGPAAGPGGPAPGPVPGPRPGNIPQRFGSLCPVCNRSLGRPPGRDGQGRRVEPPALRLEVGRADLDGTLPWRFAPLDAPWDGRASNRPLFSEYDVEFVYLLCANGHIFPDTAPLRHVGAGPLESPEFRINRFRIVAAIGPSGSGKTYLILRTLMQSLVNPFAGADGSRVQAVALSPLERIPRAERLESYDTMLVRGYPIPPTRLRNEGTPRVLLQDRLPGLVEAIEAFIRRYVVNGERRAVDWGRELRQPLVLRTQFGQRRTWTGVADLPGEQFMPEHEDSRFNARLNLYDGLIWVIDPILASNVHDWFQPGTLGSVSADEVLEGSLRPGDVQVIDAEKLRAARNRVQHTIGQTLGLVDSVFRNPNGDTLSSLIAINKADLIHSALKRKSLPDLAGMGEPGHAVQGATSYLLDVTKQFRRGYLTPDQGAYRLLMHVNGANNARPEARQRVAASVATGILAHFSDPDAFHGLVHGGHQRDAFTTGIPGDGTQWHVVVPTISEHMNAWNEARSTERLLQMRDLVMSVVGCAVAYGLGYANAVWPLLDFDRNDTRFFLCSPLEHVPVARNKGADPTIEPLGAARFPDPDTQSAALTQLLIAILGRADG